MRELLALHGASGPLAFVVLLAEAAAGLQGRDHPGVVEMSWRDFAEHAGIDRDEAPERLREMACPPFTLVDVETQDGLGFRARFPRWHEWMPKDPTGAERTRRWREKKAAEDAARDGR